MFGITETLLEGKSVIAVLPINGERLACSVGAAVISSFGDVMLIAKMSSSFDLSVVTHTNSTRLFVFDGKNMIPFSEHGSFQLNSLQDRAGDENPDSRTRPPQFRSEQG